MFQKIIEIVIIVFVRNSEMWNKLKPPPPPPPADIKGTVAKKNIPLGHQSGSALWLQLCNIWAS